MKPRQGRILIPILVIVVVAGGLLLRAAVAAPKDGSADGLTLQTCASLPALWSGASETEYEPKSDTVRFVWGHSETSPGGGALEARIKATDARCIEQPGLEAYAAGLKRGIEETRRNDCQSLRTLVEVLREQDPGAKGRVVVPSGTDEEVARRRKPGSTAGAQATSDAIRAKDGQGTRTIDITQAESTLRDDCAR